MSRKAPDSILALMILVLIAGPSCGGGGTDAPGPDTHYDTCLFCADYDESSPPQDTSPDLKDTLSDTLPDVVEEDTPYTEDTYMPDWGDVVYPDTQRIEIAEEEVTSQPVTYENFGVMTLSRKGILIGSKYMQFRFARLDYWKVPAEQWDRRLTMIREAGFNGIATAACWAKHEPKQGTIDFTSSGLSVTAFLELAASKGLYIYFIAGPWIGEGAPGGCLPDWLYLKPGVNAALSTDSKIVPREADKDFVDALAPYFNQLNAIVGPRQITKSQSAKILFYQLEESWDIYANLKETMMAGLEFVTGTPVAVKRPNGMQYFATLRQMAQTGGISVPMVTSLTGRLESGGRFVTVLGETPNVMPAFRFSETDPYEDFEGRLVALKKELRSSTMHGATYSSVPAIVTACRPFPGHISRLLAAGADVVVVDGFDSYAQPLGSGIQHVSAPGPSVFSALAAPAMELVQNPTPYLGVFSSEGIPTERYYALRRTVRFLDRVSSLIGSRDMPLRTGPNQSSVVPFSVSNASVGAVEGEWVAPELTETGGANELFQDSFESWYVTPPVAPVSRANYMIYGSDGTTLINLINVEDLTKTGENSGKRTDQITKLTMNDVQLPRHSNITIPSLDRENLGPGLAGCGNRFLYLNHPLGAGYPVVEYSSASIAEEREFNGRMLLVLFGEPKLKANGVWLTEPGELSIMGFSGTPTVVYNKLEGGGIYADPGGKMAIQIQHDLTSVLVLGLPSKKTLQVVGTTTDAAERLWFGKDTAGWDVGVSGFDSLESVSSDSKSTKMVGKMSPGKKDVLVFTQVEPEKITVDGNVLTCTRHSQAMLSVCTWTEPDPKKTIQGFTGFASRVEPAVTKVADLGTTTFADAFVTQDGKALPAASPSVMIQDGVSWYAATVTVNNVPAETEEVSIDAESTSDLLSVYLNGTYIGSAATLGNHAILPEDLQKKLGARGIRFSPTLLKQGENFVAFRVLILGRSDRYLPEIQSFVPVLGEEYAQYAQDQLSQLVIPGLNPHSLKGLAGQAYLHIGVGKLPIAGSWTMSKGDTRGLGRSFGMLSDWHKASGAAVPSGWTSVSAPTASVPVSVGDGETRWISAAFNRDLWTAEGTGGLDLVLEGKGLVALVFANGNYVGKWYSDELTVNQGLHSEIQGGAVVKAAAVPAPGPAARNRLRLPAEALIPANNRVTVVLFDLTPKGDADLEVEGFGTIPGKAVLTRMELSWNQDLLLPGTDVEPGALVQRTRTLEITPQPVLPPQ